MRDKTIEPIKILEEIRSLAKDISDDEIKAVVLDLLENPRITFAKIEPRITLLESPAAPRKHHAYPGGLLEHTLSVTRISMNIAKALSETYDLLIDLDLVIAAAILHDLFKYYQYEWDPAIEAYRPRTDWYLSHDFAMVAELSLRHAPDKLIRAIAEVHGNVPFTMIESLIVHHADSMDANLVARIQDILWEVSRDIETETGYPAVKSFYKALRILDLNNILRTYRSKGRSGLREEVKRVLGISQDS